MGVCGEASIHPPVPLDGVLGTRATALEHEGSHNDGGQRREEAPEHGSAAGEMALTDGRCAGDGAGGGRWMFGRRVSSCVEL